MEMFSSVKKRFFGMSESVENLSPLEVIKPLYVILSLFGLFPYSVKFPKDRKCVLMIRNSIYLNSICSVSVILILCLSFIFHVREVLEVTDSSSMTEVLMTKLNYILELFGLLMFCTVSYIAAYKNRLIYVKIFNGILSLFNKVIVYRNKEPIMRSLKCQVKLVMGFLCFALGLKLLVNCTRGDSLWKIILVTLSFIFPQMIQFIVIGFFYTMVMTVVAVLRSINEEIRSVTKARSVTTEFVKVGPRQVSFRQLEEVFVKVLEVKREINRAFQPCILATSLQCFHSIVSESHIIYRGLLNSGTFSIHDICNCSLWILYQLLKIYVIANTGNLLKLEAAKIGRSLYNMSTDKQDVKLFLEVQHFSTLISYQAVELNVYGYFPLDTTLLFNIVSSAAMYLTICVQLDKNA